MPDRRRSVAPVFSGRRAGAGHGHPPAATQKVDLHQVSVTLQEGQAFPVIEPPALGVGAFIRGRKDFDAGYQSMFGVDLANFQERLAVFRFDQRAHHDRCGIRPHSRSTPRSFEFSRSSCRTAAGSDRDVGQELSLLPVVVQGQCDVGSLAGADDVAIRENFRERALDFTNEISVEIFPQVTGLDVWVHARERRFHIGSFLSRRASTHSIAPPVAREGRLPR